MFKKLKELALGIGVFGLLAVPVAIPAAVSADNAIANNTCNGVNVASDTTASLNPGPGDTSCATGTTGTSGIQNLLKLVVNVFSIVVGFVAVVMIIYGGVKYITSGGDSNNISSAKNTIVYAIIGLLIVAIAQVIVHFVLEKSATIGT
jgi:hypothetical protein